MRIAISGKGGSGKTTIAGALAVSLNRNGHKVLAIDGDSDPNLAFSLGVSHEAAQNIPVFSDQFPHLAKNSPTIPRYIENYGYQTPEGIPLLVMGRVDHADQGCLCKVYAVTNDLLEQLNYRKQLVTLLDTTPNMEYLQRGSIRSIDMLLLVVEPAIRSLETAERIRNAVRPLHINHINVVGNKVKDEDDRQMILNFCQRQQLPHIANLPFDAALRNSGPLPEELQEALKKIRGEISGKIRLQTVSELLASISERFLFGGNTRLSHKEILAIRLLEQCGTITMSQLAEQLRLPYSSSTAIADRLVAKKLIQRTQNPADRRVFFVTLTEKGKYFFRDYLAEYERLVRNMLHPLSESEEIALIDLMKKFSN